MAKPLSSRWVVVPRELATLPPITSDISSLKRSSDVIRLFTRKNSSPALRLSIRKAAAALDKVVIEITIRDREIKRLRA